MAFEKPNEAELETEPETATEKKEGVKKFSPETEREFLQVALKYAIEQGEKINEGAEAIIYSIDASGLSPQQQELLFGQPIDQDVLAAKIIKIFRGTYQGQKEEVSQERAYEVLASQKALGVAKVPKPYGYHELDCQPEDELMTKLKFHGVTPDKKISILFMDYVHGEDVMTYLYKKALEIHEKKYEADENLTGLFNAYYEDPTFENLQNLTSRLLNFTQPKKKLDNADQLISAEENWKILSDFLARNEFVLDKSIIEKLRRSLKVLQENNFYHNDLHERNIMFELDDDGNIIDVYLIDFSKADDHKSEEVSGTDIQYVNRLAQLTVSRKQAKQEALSDLSHQAQRVIEQNSPEFNSQLAIITEQLDERNFEGLFAYLSIYIDRDEAKVLAFFNQLNTDPTYQPLIEEFLESVAKNKHTNRPQFWLDLRSLLDKSSTF